MGLWHPRSRPPRPQWWSSFEGHRKRCIDNELARPTMSDGTRRRGFLATLAWLAVVMTLSLLALAEYGFRYIVSGGRFPDSVPRELAIRFLVHRRVYALWRSWFLDNIWLLGLGTIAAVALVLLGLR